MLVFGVLGYVLRKLEYEPAPLILAYVLGPMLERNLRQALRLSDGDLSIFLTRPLSAASLFISFILMLGTVLPSLQKKRTAILL